MQELSFFASRSGLPLLRHFGGGLLNARVSSGGKLGLEFLDPSGRIDVFELAGKERMASRADIDLQLFFGAAGLEGIAATARDDSLNVVGMDAVLHGSFLRQALATDLFNWESMSLSAT